MVIQKQRCSVKLTRILILSDDDSDDKMTARKDHCHGRHRHRHYGLWKAKRFQISRSIYGTHHLPQFTQQSQSAVFGEQTFSFSKLINLFISKCQESTRHNNYLAHFLKTDFSLYIIDKAIMQQDPSC